MPVVGKGWLSYPQSSGLGKEEAMSVLVLFRWEGDPDELLAAYDREMEHPVARVQPRRISHTCAIADDGMVIVDMWHSREDFQKLMEDPEFQENLQASGWPSEPQGVEVYEAHATIP
jgi:hypothetical protein